MSTTEDKTVTPEPAKPATGAAAFAEARASLQSKDQGEPVADVTTPPTETPAQEPEKVADEPTETTTQEDASLSADELAKLSPKERAQAEKWQGKLTRRAQELSAKEKQYEQWKPLIDGFTANPEATMDELAKQLGMTVMKPKVQDTAATDIQQKFTKALASLPEELRPMFQPFAEALASDVLTSVEGRIKPLAEAHSMILSEAAAAETEATLEAFGAKHPDWKQFEPQILSLAQKFIPTAGSMDSGEYMETLYKLIKADTVKADLVKETVERITKSVESSEPKTAGISEVRVEQTMPANWADMTGKERMKAAYDAAGRGVLWKK